MNFLFPTCLFIFCAGTKGFSVSNRKAYSDSDIKRVINNPAALDQVPYNQLIGKIKNKEISKIFLSNKRDQVISETKLESDDIYTDFFVTDIIPEIATDLIDISVQNKVEPVFKLKADPPNPIQLLAAD